MFSFLKKKKIENFLRTDIHSHLLPGIDDGVQTIEESVKIIHGLSELGFEKIITTPHIIGDFYPNTPEIISSKLSHLKAEVSERGINIEIEAAAEYLIDDHFISLLNSEEKLLTFGDSFILIETPFLNKPLFLEDVIFKLKAQGYQPVLAHPERYLYLQEDYSLIQEILNTNVLLQLNLTSLVGHYSKGAQKLAEYLIDNNQINFLGSDIHNVKHFDIYQKGLSSKYFDKCRQLFLYNNTL
ncbi:MAG: protein-tyrosine phosphatase [Cyclobacteriaceae bacterium]